MNSLRTAASILLAAILIVGCGKKEPEIKLKEPGFKKYPFKSAVIEYRYGGEATGTMIQYVDYWGAREVSEDHSSVKYMGTDRKNNALTIFDQDSVIMIDLDKKEGIRKINEMWMATLQQWKSMKPEQQKDFANEQLKMLAAQAGAKKLGTETILGKTCDIYEATGYKQSFWNGMLMRMEIEMNGMKMSMVATKLATDVDIPAEKFLPPVGIKISAMNPHEGMGMPPQGGGDPHAQQGDPHAQQGGAHGDQADPHAGVDMSTGKEKKK